MSKRAFLPHKIIASAIAVLLTLQWPMCLPAQAEINLPSPNQVFISKPLNPSLLKGIKVFADKPFKFDFVMVDSPRSEIDSPRMQEGNQAQNEEVTKLVKYFLAGLTIPEGDLWVNLSPYEKNRIVPESFGLTGMGRDVLAQDYLLKQLTANLMHPDSEIGKEFWKRIYQEAKKQGISQLPVNALNKVWILPAQAEVYEGCGAHKKELNSNNGVGRSPKEHSDEGGYHNVACAYITKATLKVMLEEDYVASKNFTLQKFGSNATIGNVKQIIASVILPVIEKEVNEGENFATLRQVYNSLILATWYKEKIKKSLIAKEYVNQRKVNGTASDNQEPTDIETIYQEYIKSFKKGAYNLIREEPDPITGNIIPRKYFAGGLELKVKFDYAMQAPQEPSGAKVILVDIFNNAALINGIKDNYKRMIDLSSADQRHLLPDYITRIGDELAILDRDIDPDLYIDHFTTFKNGLSALSSEIDRQSDLTKIGFRNEDRNTLRSLSDNIFRLSYELQDTAKGVVTTALEQRFRTDKAMTNYDRDVYKDERLEIAMRAIKHDGWQDVRGVANEFLGDIIDLDLNDFDEISEQIAQWSHQLSEYINQGQYLFGYIVLRQIYSRMIDVRNRVSKTTEAKLPSVETMEKIFDDLDSLYSGEIDHRREDFIIDSTLIGHVIKSLVMPLKSELERSKLRLQKGEISKENFSIENLTIELDSISERIFINGDQRKILNILRTLAINAYQIANERGLSSVHLKVSAVSEAGRVKLIVEDNAGGFKGDKGKELLAKDANGVQQAFKMNASNRNGGTGLGLAEVWHIVMLHGGEASVSNITNTSGELIGARFEFDFPSKEVKNEVVLISPIQQKFGDNPNRISDFNQLAVMINTRLSMIKSWRESDGYRTGYDNDAQRVIEVSPQGTRRYFDQRGNWVLEMDANNNPTVQMSWSTDSKLSSLRYRNIVGSWVNVRELPKYVSRRNPTVNMPEVQVELDQYAQPIYKFFAGDLGLSFINEGLIPRGDQATSMLL